MLTNREMVNFQKFDFLRFFFINCVTTGVRELNGISQTGPDPIIQNAKCESPRWAFVRSRENVLASCFSDVKQLCDFKHTLTT